MELVFVIWMIEVVTNIHMWINLKGLLVLIVVLNILFAIAAPPSLDFNLDRIKSAYFSPLKYKKSCIATVLACLFGSVWNSLVPSKETAYLMLGAYGVQSAYEVVTESEETKRIAKKSLSIIEEALDKYQKESNNEPKNEKETKVEQGE